MTTYRRFTTDRGFQRIDFEDANGGACSLQQSSAALCEKPGAGAIWLGAGENRMHLTHEQTRQIMRFLREWLASGDLF